MVKQKVIAVNVYCPASKIEENPMELELKKVNKLLDEGYMVSQVHQMPPSGSVYAVTYIFVLVKQS